jgi:predicted RND superfamily exporter protein
MLALVRWRWAALAALLVVLAAAVPGLKTAAVPDNALTVWFLESDPGLVAYRKFQDAFGNDEVLLVLVEAEDALSEPVLDRVGAFVAAAGGIEGVRRVHSVLTVRDAWTDEGGALTFGPALSRPVTPENRARLLANALLIDRLVSADGRRLMLQVEMVATPDFDARRDSIVAAVREAADEHLGAPKLGGIGVIYSGLNVITQHDFGLFVAVGYVIIFGLMGWLYRSARLVLAAVGVVASATVLALGAYGWMGHRLNMVTVVLPTLIIVLGLADVVHFPAAFAAQRARRPDQDRTGAVADALGSVWQPCLMTTLTTMAGFAALLASPMAVIRHLGGFAALGVGTALLASLVLSSVALHSLPEGWRPQEHPRTRAFLQGVRGLLMRHPAAMAAFSLLLSAAAGVGALQVEADTYTIGYLPDDHRVVRDHAAIEAGWGPYALLDFLVHAEGDARVDSAPVLAAQERFVARALQEPEIASGLGLPDLYRRMADVLGIDHRGRPMPKDLVAQLGLLIELQDLDWDPADPAYGDNVVAPVLREDGRLGRMTLTGAMLSAKQLEGLLDRLHAIADQEFAGVGRLEAAGYPPLYTEIVDYAMTSQIRGFFGALALIFLLMLVWLRSLRLALVSLLPNVFPVLVMLAVMGSLGIHLDIATATVAAIVVGVSIDDTVHFLRRWRLAELEGMDWDGALEQTFEHSGVPAVITTLLLLVGYPVLMLAEVKTVVAFGLLTSIAAAAALFGDLVLLPLLLKAWRR